MVNLPTGWGKVRTGYTGERRQRNDKARKKARLQGTSWYERDVLGKKQEQGWPLDLRLAPQKVCVLIFDIAVRADKPS